MLAQSKILIVDDHPIFRKGLAQLINEEKDMAVCGEAETVFDAQKQIGKLAPDIVIVDMTLKDMSGLELIRYVRERYPDLPVLVLSMHDESLYAERVLRAGARGYIMKQEMTDRVITGIRQVLAGKIFVSEAMAESLIGKATSKKTPAPMSPVDGLSDRELEIFTMIGRGVSRGEMAEKLNLSVKTVGTYREKIKEKLNLKNSAELVKCAVEWVKETGAE
ncbi:MAG: response regulator transcription factor [Spirochaetes bacterium]|nr:response regulator transcription factor [Spirochaetota bacterium]